MATSQKFYSDIDLNQNQILNPKFQMVSVFPRSPVIGQFCYLTVAYSNYKANLPYYYNGIDWIPFKAGGSNNSSSFFFDFSLPEMTFNSNKFFYSWNKGSYGNELIPSNSISGLNDEIIPIICPLDGTITKAILKIKGAGVQNNTVSYPAYIKINVYKVSASSEGTSNSIYFPIPSTSEVLPYAFGNTNSTIEVDDLKISLSKGDLISLEFDITGNTYSSASAIAYINNVFVSLELD